MVVTFTRDYFPASSQEFQAAHVTAASRTIFQRLPSGRIMSLNFPNHRVAQGDWRSWQFRSTPEIEIVCFAPLYPSCLPFSYAYLYPSLGEFAAHREW